VPGPRVPGPLGVRSAGPQAPGPRAPGPLGVSLVSGN
jgi:hypothetical protein